jgi:hypothetical protein
VALIGNPRLIIVDEPTAGLDPAERARFLNLLSELGENSVVILSTHIVEDVSDLCTRMAIIQGGRILLEGEPARAVDAVRGRIWRRQVDRAELPAFEHALPVISTTLVGGRTVIHVYGDAAPDATFEAVEPDLKDVYFTAIRGIAIDPRGLASAGAAPAPESPYVTRVMGDEPAAATAGERGDGDHSAPPGDATDAVSPAADEIPPPPDRPLDASEATEVQGDARPSISPASPESPIAPVAPIPPAAPESPIAPVPPVAPTEPVPPRRGPGAANVPFFGEWGEGPRAGISRENRDAVPASDDDPEAA